MSNCIFYLPYRLDEKAMGARMMRPRKMIHAFEDIGYNVFVVSGMSKERKILIQELKRKIKGGEKYDFIYTESHTIPTLLTDPDHIPRHPLMDFGFFKFAKKNGIRIGLFYPDIYWKFTNYGEGISKFKKIFALANYRYDVLQYKKNLDKFYVPDIKVCDYLGESQLTKIASELLPGADDLILRHSELNDRDFKHNPLRIFYVGGIGNQYQITELFKAVTMTENTQLTVCCREKEWEKEKTNYEKYINDRIRIIHKSGDELEPYYEEADICSLLFKQDIYREMAKPYKAFEYLAHEMPVLSTKGTAIGAFVEKNDIGWNIEFDSKSISDVLKKIMSDATILNHKKATCKKVKQDNLWKVRAKQVVADLL